MSPHAKDHDDAHAHDEHADHDADHDVDGQQGASKGTVSEGGSSALNAETALGGADSVPETPDNTKDQEDKQGLNVEGKPSDAASE